MCRVYKYTHNVAKCSIKYYLRMEKQAENATFPNDCMHPEASPATSTMTTPTTTINKNSISSIHCDWHQMFVAN